MHKIPFWLLAATLVACSGSKTTGTDTGSTVDQADADTDADADSDADSDADTDSDTDADSDTDTSTTPTDTSLSAFACYADYYAVAVVKGANYQTDIGVDQYDTANTDELIHLQRDSQSDGTIDQDEKYTYDAAGHVTHQELSEPGEAPYAEDFTYDADGHVLTDTIDTNIDGTVDSIETFTYDADGHQTLDNLDSDGDGTLDFTYATTYDAYGNPLSAEEDTDGDGTVDALFSYTVDASNRITAIEGVDATDGTLIVFEETISYPDDLGSFVEDLDRDGDGTLDDEQIVTFDNNDLIVFFSDDATPGDGKVDLSQTLEWDTVNKLITHIDEFIANTGPAGEADVSADLTYDGQNRRIGEAEHVAEPKVNFEYDYDATWTFAGSCP